MNGPRPTAGSPVGDSIPLPPAVCVLGLGLIGGSLLRAAGAMLPVSGWSPTASTRTEAGAAGFRVHPELETALQWAADQHALVVLAAPVTAFDRLLRKITRYSPEVLLTDVGGVKGPVAEQVSAIAPHTRYIGSHPMAGTAESGFGAGNDQLFRGAVWVTCLDPASSLDAWDVIAGLALAVGSTVVPCTAVAHDQAVARISHLPHLLALALAQVAELGGPLALSLAAGSFTDATRVAATRAELIRVMCEANRQPLVDAFDDALGILGVARGSLASTGSLQKITDGGHDARMAFEHRRDDLRDVRIEQPSIDDLITLGNSGGFVREIVRTASKRTVFGREPS